MNKVKINIKDEDKPRRGGDRRGGARGRGSRGGRGDKRAGEKTED